MQTCSYCGRESKILLKEEKWCNACYQRWWTKGTVEYNLKPSPKPCSVKDCDKLAKAKGFCDKHYVHFLRHGHTENTRPKGWGDKVPNVHYDRWYRLMSVYKEEVCEEWKDFWKFVEDIGDPPENCKLHRLNTKRPWNKNNFYWRPNSEYSKIYKPNSAAYAREARKANNNSFRSHDLKRMYGITWNDLNRMLEEQNDCCAICGKPETSIDHRSKQVRRLAVDHCHMSNKVRGLLCGTCNNMLGCAKDSIEILQAAITYLQSHAKPKTQKLKLQPNVNLDVELYLQEPADANAKSA